METVGHRLPLFSVFFLCGVCAAQYFPGLPHPLWFLLAIPLAWALWRWRALWPLLALVLGLIWAFTRAAWILHYSLPPALIGQDIWISGRVASLPTATPYALQFVFDTETLTSGDRAYPSLGRVRLRWYDQGAPPSLQAGERWRFKVRLKPPRGYQNPGGFDYEAWLFRQRIRATGYVRDDADNKRLSPAPLIHVDRWRQNIAATIKSSLHSEAAGLLNALAVGVRDGVTLTQWDVLRRTGTAHLLAISGLHVGLAAGLGMLLGAGLWRCSVRLLLWRPAQQAGAVLGLLVAFCYAALAGFSIPTQRALIMIVVLMLACLSRRPVWSAQVLGIALLLVLLWDPLAVLDAGFWLSFTAVAVIFWALLKQQHQTNSIWLRRIKRWWQVQWLLWLMLSPLLLALFGQVALTSPLANLIAVPVVAFVVVPLVLTGVACHAVGLTPIAIGTWQWAAEVLMQLWPFLDGLANVELGVWRGAGPSGWTLAAAVLGVMILALPRGMRGRGLGVFLVLPALFPTPAPIADGTFKGTVLDVGQGLAMVVQTRKHTLLYDTGARYRSGFDLGTAVVVPYLRQYAYRHGLMGPVQVDTLVISHGDNDHIGGLQSVFASTRVVRRLSSVPQKVPGASACVTGQSWQWDGVRFEVLHPAHAAVPAHNNASCVVKITGRYGSMLLTGDIEAQVEQRLLQHRAKLRSDVLLVPHQGSQTSSTAEFIAAVQPQLAVVSTGYHNRYGHPHPKVVTRYKQAQIPFYDTAVSGALIVKFDEGGISLDEQREQGRRYWFSP